MTAFETVKNINPKSPWWGKKAHPVTSEGHVGVELMADFHGDAADAVSTLPLFGHFVHRAPGFTRITIPPKFVQDGCIVYGYEELVSEAGVLGVRESSFFWQFMRTYPDVRIKASRESEGFKSWSFGSAHPKTGEEHPYLGGRLIDFRPSNPPEEFEWNGFDPVWLNIWPKADDFYPPRIIRVRTEWSSSHGVVTLFADKNLENIPPEVLMMER